MVNLVFYGDNSTAEMYKTSLLSLDEGCALFRPGGRILLNKAVKEALHEQHEKTIRTLSLTN